MNTLDLVILLLFILSLIGGWKRGLLTELGALAVLLLFPWALVTFSGPLTDFLYQLNLDFPLARLLATVIPAALLLVGGNLLAGLIQRALPDILLPFNSLAGAFLALLKTAFLLGLAASFLGRVPMVSSLPLWQESAFIEPLAAIGEFIFLNIANIFTQPKPDLTSPGELI
ncbi:MAG: CvpA family protein [Firmicutes bacterium]|jgi:uncharacterized membrane protein required for colicin V production|nr:CvpA family protein [Bacillota bacterium]HOB22529.1 CvpA family protein [Bacillota bacterium]HQD38967.1 CvpA family protein [Bacillota bacterium]